MNTAKTLNKKLEFDRPAATSSYTEIIDSLGKIELETDWTVVGTCSWPLVVPVEDILFIAVTTGELFKSVLETVV